MLNLDPAKLLVIAIVGIILLGPDKLPQVAKQAGAAWRTLNEFRHRMEAEVRNTIPDLPPTSEIARLARSPSALLNHLSTMSDEDEDADGKAAADGDAVGDGVPDGAYRPPGGTAAGAGVAGAADGAGNGAGPARPAPADGAGASSAGATPATDGAAVRPSAPTNGDSAPATSPGRTVPAPPAPEPQVLAPGDPTLN
jgi:Sec-independent protein translocase protein TatA